MIGKIRDDDVARGLHSICYGKPGKQTTRKKGLRAFNGWADASVAKTKAEKLAGSNKIKVSMIKEICGVLGLEKSGTKEELCGRVTEFLADPSGENVVKSVPKKRKAAKVNKCSYTRMGSVLLRPLLPLRVLPPHQVDFPTTPHSFQARSAVMRSTLRLR